MERSLVSELLIMKCLGHPNTLTIYGYVVDEDRNIVFEYAPYGDVLYITDKYKKYQLPFTLHMSWIFNIANRLEYIHSHGIKHKDLKGVNTLWISIHQLL